jgi:hypothetical protein
MFKKLIGIWIIVLILGAAGLGKSPPQQPEPRRVTTTTPTTTPAPSKTTIPSAPVICNEADMACRKQAEQRLQQEQEWKTKWESIARNPESFCETFKQEIQTVTGVKTPCLTEDPTYRAVRDGVRDAMRRQW